MTPTSFEQKSFVSHSGCLEEILEYVRERAAHSAFQGKDLNALLVGVEEACTNIIKHTYHYNPNHRLTLGWRDQGDSVVVEIEDDSPDPYLPALPDFDLESKIRYRHYSGYGIHLLQRAMDDVQYETIPGSHNKVTLVKFHEGKAPKKKNRIQDPYAMARAQAASLTAIFEATHLFSRGTSLYDIGNQTLYSIVGRIAAQPVVLLAPQTLDGSFTIAAQTGLSTKINKSSLYFSKSSWVLETLAAHRGPFLTSRFESMKIPDVELDVLDQIRSQVLIPIVVMNKLRGILSLGRKRTGRPFTESDMSFVTHLATMLILLMRARSIKNIEGSMSSDASLGSDLRACCRVAIFKVIEISKESGLSLQFDEPQEAVPVLMDKDMLQKVLVTLLMHSLFATEPGHPLQIHIEPKEESAALILEYQGNPLSFERGKNGYNTLVDKMLTASVRLSEILKVIAGYEGEIRVEKDDDQYDQENQKDDVSESQVKIVLELPVLKK